MFPFGSFFLFIVKGPCKHLFNKQALPSIIFNVAHDPSVKNKNKQTKNNQDDSQWPTLFLPGHEKQQHQQHP